jgi:hypothetical protein
LSGEKKRWQNLRIPSERSWTADDALGRSGGCVPTGMFVPPSTRSGADASLSSPPPVSCFCCGFEPREALSEFILVTAGMTCAETTDSQINKTKIKQAAPQSFHPRSSRCRETLCNGVASFRRAARGLVTRSGISPQHGLLSPLAAPAGVLQSGCGWGKTHRHSRTGRGP